jgi:hypothetical protein
VPVSALAWAAANISEPPRYIAAEDVLADPWIGAAAHPVAAAGMPQRGAVEREQSGHATKTSSAYCSRLACSNVPTLTIAPHSPAASR